MTRSALVLFVVIAALAIGFAFVAVVDAFTTPPPACTEGASSVTATWNPELGEYVESESHATGCRP